MLHLSRPSSPGALPADTPSVRYFEAMQGRWAGPYRFALTAPAALAAHVGAPSDRWRVRLLAGLGGGTMRTTVAWASADEIRHTTLICSLGLPALWAVEKFRLQADGTHLAVEMFQRLAPAFWPARTFPGGSGEVRELGGADYRLPWLGGTIEQTVRRAGADTVELEQRAAWFEAGARLQRIESASLPPQSTLTR